MTTPGTGPAANKVYGIDLGTTYSCIAQVDEYGRPAVIPERRQSAGDALGGDVRLADRHRGRHPGEAERAGTPR
ncbi:hypothetical protein [Fodinicola feengrottensis]|uniref:hypothetical protein n=1 Tax=Fodinicola feengrottensis TaxID=435914 RepID=UPI00244329BE|nr:hypothetical protein [Fodinicola feengrottensis]